MKVLITKSSGNGYWYADLIGEVFDVEDTPFKFEGYNKYRLADGSGRCVDAEDFEKITVIDGVKYREVKRKATVGERILRTSSNLWTKAGASGVVVEVGNATVRVKFDYGEYVDLGGTITWHNDHDKYVVLEPIREAESDICDLIELQRQLNEFRSQQTELAKQIDGLTDAFAKLLAAKTAGGGLTGRGETVVKPKSRDEIVAQAKRDVAELSVTKILAGNVPALDGVPEPFFSGEDDYVDFIVNREKRTVVALLRYTDGNGVWGRGIAKAAPGDVFNTHIGRAIALRRALGLEVPTEYTHAPQPEDVRVGDVVCHRDFPDEITVVVDIYDDDCVKVEPYEDGSGEEVYGFRYEVAVVIDDSDRYTSDDAEVFA